MVIPWKHRTRQRTENCRVYKLFWVILLIFGQFGLISDLQIFPTVDPKPKVPDNAIYIACASHQHLSAVFFTDCRENFIFSTASWKYKVRWYMRFFLVWFEGTCAMVFFARQLLHFIYNLSRFFPSICGCDCCKILYILWSNQDRFAWPKFIILKFGIFCFRRSGVFYFVHILYVGSFSSKH